MIKIIFDNIPKIVIASLIGYTYFFVGWEWALMMSWYLILSRFTNFVQERRETK